MTYASLTDDQLRQIALLVIGDDYKGGRVRIDRNKDGVWINTGPSEVFLDQTTGDINYLYMGHQEGINNLWKVITRCQQWGVEYGKEVVGA